METIILYQVPTIPIVKIIPPMLGTIVQYLAINLPTNQPDIPARVALFPHTATLRGRAPPSPQ